jgi:hypothetical protein
MKSLFILFIFTCSFIVSSAQTQEPATKPDPTKKIQTVEASCGQCNFGLKVKGCDLAVRINGKAYFVDGTAIDSHGDAHAEDGFCNTVRKADVQGEIVKDRFKATYFKLLPLEVKKD